MIARHHATSLSHPPPYERLLHLPLGKPMQAEQEFIELLDNTLMAPPDRSTMFDILEQARASLCFLREAAVRHYLEAAPHLEGDAEKHFQRGIEATRRMLRSYSLCANLDKTAGPSWLADNPARASQVATVLHRCLYYSARLIYEHYRAKRELRAGMWAQHNLLFASASRLGVATLQVDDRIFDETRTTHCQAAFLTPLLVEQACPYGRDPWELNFIWGWAERMAPEINVVCGPRTPSAATFGVDLGQDAPLQSRAWKEAGTGVLQLETWAATGRLRRILDDLARGAPPERLGLCEDTVKRSRDLLEQLLFLWSLEDTQRRQQPRQQERGSALLCTGFHAMHHGVLGTDSATVRLAQSKRLDGGEPPGREEAWEVIDRGSSGFRLASQGTTTRLFNGQLIALRPEGSSRHFVGQASWLKREQSGRLVAGIAILPGIPQAVCIRPLSRVRGEKSSFARALLLRPEPGQSVRSSLLLAAGTKGRLAEMEVFYDRSVHLNLGEEILRGTDFVQIGIGPA